MDGQEKKSAGSDTEVTPAVTPLTLTATMKTIQGSSDTGFIRITLCGFGSAIPVVPGVGVIAEAGVPQTYGPGPSISESLYGNDVILPSSTFYEIAVLDEFKNVVQANNYLLTGSGTIDLSTLPPVTQPYGFPISALKYLPAIATSDPTVWNPPGSTVLAVTYNGVLLPQNDSTHLSWSMVGGQIKLSFTPGPTELIAAFSVVNYHP